MNDDTRMRLRLFETLSSQRHIAEQDHYLYRRAPARIALNLIGTGTIGQEHMRVATLLGRARVHGIYDQAPRSLDIAEQEFAQHTSTPLVRYAVVEKCL